MKLADYLYNQYGLILLESEIHDILEIARQEIELPSDEEIEDKCCAIANPESKKDFERGEWLGFKEGAKWALYKVRNPYPKTM